MHWYSESGESLYGHGEMRVMLDMDLVTGIVTLIVLIMTLVGMVFGAMKIIVISPLQTSMNRLEASIEKFSDRLLIIERGQNNMDVRIGKLEEKASSAHKRIDELVKEVRKE